MSRPILLLMLFMASAWLQPAIACTMTGGTNINLGSRTSFDARTADPQAGSGASGLNCQSILNLLSSQYIYVTLGSITPLTHSASGDTINFSVGSTASGAALQTGVTSGNLASGSLLSFSASGDVNLFVRLDAASNVSAGTYTGTIDLRWHYATCPDINAIGVCTIDWLTSPGVTQNCVTVVVRLCTLNTGSIPTSIGTAITINVTLTISADCRFDADEVQFGSAPFVSSFDPVIGQLRITCTKGSTFDVGLGNGLAHNGRRRMRDGTNHLEYDLYSPANTLWNATTQRVQQAIPADGLIAQLFAVEARIYTDQATPPPGTYADTVIIDVQF